MRFDDLRARVAENHDSLGLPSWPDPHTGMGTPRDDEYSRVTDPARYGIVHTRAHLWAEQLGDLPDVSVEPLAPAVLADSRHFDRGVRITPARAGTLPLLLLERGEPQPEASVAVLHISVVRTGIALAMLPACGCDACDRGTDDLLAAIDQTIGTVVDGPLVALRGAGWAGAVAA